MGGCWPPRSAALSVVMVWLVVVSPVVDWYGARAGQLAALRERAAHEEAQIAAMPLLRREAEAAAKTPAHSVLAGKTGRDRRGGAAGTGAEHGDRGECAIDECRDAAGRASRGLPAHRRAGGAERAAAGGGAVC